MEEASFHLAVAEAACDRHRALYQPVRDHAAEWLAEDGPIEGPLLLAKAATGVRFYDANRRCERASEAEWRAAFEAAKRAWITYRQARDAYYAERGEPLWTSARCSSTTPSTCSPTGRGGRVSEPTLAVIYAAKSTEDRHGSIPTQVKDCRALAERQGWTVVGEETDEAFSAFSGNRGPGLERAKALAASTSAEHGRCVLVAQDADRFARGAGDAPGAADHLAEVYFSMRRQRVALWTERTGELDLICAALEGERNHDESARKTQAVKAGKRRQAERGEHLGGPLPDGYRGEPYLTERGDKRQRTTLDPERADVVRGIFRLAEEGVPDAAIARSLNARGVTTRKGNPWTRRAVQDLLTRPFYAGRVSYDGESFPGRHEALLDPAAWERLMAARGERDLGHGRHVTRPPGEAARASAAGRLRRLRAAHGLLDEQLPAQGRRPPAHLPLPRLRRVQRLLRRRAQSTPRPWTPRCWARWVICCPTWRRWLAQVTERQSGERDRLEARARPRAGRPRPRPPAGWRRPRRAGLSWTPPTRT